MPRGLLYSPDIKAKKPAANDGDGGDTIDVPDHIDKDPSVLDITEAKNNSCRRRTQVE